MARQTPPVPIESMYINVWCLKDILQYRNLLCGCPLCCQARGQTAVFKVEHFETGVYPLGWWPKSVCSEKLALLCRERIVPEWPGGAAYDPKEGSDRGG